MKLELEKIRDLELECCEHGSDSTYFTNMMYLTKATMGERVYRNLNDIYQQKVIKICNLLSIGYSINKAMARVNEFPNRFFDKIDESQKRQIRITRLTYKIKKK
jgi:hypothetical protein